MKKREERRRKKTKKSRAGREEKGWTIKVYEKNVLNSHLSSL